jgi:hypothetical protein
MKKIFKSMLIVISIGFLGWGIVHAQTEEITLGMSRDFGYSSGTGKIQGLFSMKVTSTVRLKEVDFYIDTESIGKDSIEPYKIQFTTDDYPPGQHMLYAVGITLDERELRTKEINVLFVTADESNKAALSIVIPVLGLVLVITLLSAVFPALSARKKGTLPAGTARNYGFAGGTICPKCKRPFSLHVLGLNMLTGKLECCPHCGKWGIFRSYPIDKLREAEKAELDGMANILGNTNIKTEEELRKEIDDSKFQGM